MPTRDHSDPALASAIRRLRDEAQRTQEDVAYAAGITVGSLARVERGETNPAWTTVQRIARALKVSVAELAEEAERQGGPP